MTFADRIIGEKVLKSPIKIVATVKAVPSTDILLGYGEFWSEKEALAFAQTMHTKFCIKYNAVVEIDDCISFGTLFDVLAHSTLDGEVIFSVAVDPDSLELKKHYDENEIHYNWGPEHKQYLLVSPAKKESLLADKESTEYWVMEAIDDGMLRADALVLLQNELSLSLEEAKQFLKNHFPEKPDLLEE